MTVGIAEAPTPARHRSELGKSEIENLRVAALGHEDVRGLDVPVHDAPPMRGVQRIGNLNPQFQHLFRRKWPTADEMLQRFTIQKLHSDESLAVRVH